MSDEPKMAPHDTTKNSTRTILLGVLLVAVLAAGIGIGFALDRGDDGANDGSNGTAAGGDSSTDVVNPGDISVPGSQAATSTAKPNAPAPTGSALATVTTPPEGTLAMIDATKLKADAEYEITFSPFGYGPPQGGQTLVIRVTKAEAKNESASAMDFANRNMLAVLAAGENVAASGGTYQAKLTFRTQGDLLIPVIGDVGPVK